MAMTTLGIKITDNHYLINYLDWKLLFNEQAIFSYFERMSIFIDFFDKAYPKRIADSLCCSNDFLGEFIQGHLNHCGLVYQISKRSSPFISG
jgi:hypothetical protein